MVMNEAASAPVVSATSIGRRRRLWRGRCVLVGLDGCEIRLCGPCVNVNTTDATAGATRVPAPPGERGAATKLTYWFLLNDSLFREARPVLSFPLRP